MRKLVYLFILLFSLPAVGFGATAYVSDAIKITMRTNPGTDHKIVAMIPSGEQVDIIEPGKDWSKVSTAGGKNGWVLTRFLTTEVPAKIQLTQLQQEHDNLVKKSAAPLQEISRLTGENKTLNQDLADTRTTLEKLQASYDQLKKESAEFLKVKKNYESASKQLSEQTARADQLEGRLSKIKWQSNIKWFLSGAGVLLLGFIIGYSTKKQRRRSSLL